MTNDHRSRNLIWIVAAVFGTAVVLLVAVGLIAWTLLPRADTPPSKPVSNSLPKPEFPRLPAGVSFGSNVTMHTVRVASRPGAILGLNIFIPKGDHENQSLPVMLEAPAGTNLLHGSDLSFPDRATEFLPFTDQAGMITVTFSISGSMPATANPSSPMYMNLLKVAFRDFVQSDAGVADGKLAIDYILEKIPAADPKRIYIWGHSSAATLSLLMASKDQRISKCIAMAPITDLNVRLGELLAEPAFSRMLPGLKDYLQTGSPKSYVNQLKCPVFLSHARDDDNEPFVNSEAYVRELRQAQGNVSFLELPSGGHYQPMIEASLPKALEFLK